MKYIKNISNKVIYATESIKNRYPCQIINIDVSFDPKKSSIVTYRSVTRYNICKLDIKALISDPLLLEKFHPTDCIKLGYIAAGETLKSDAHNLMDSEKYHAVIAQMQLDYHKGGQDAQE